MAAHWRIDDRLSAPPGGRRPDRRADRHRFEVDVLDPEIAPGVGTTVRGGPTWREA